MFQNSVIGTKLVAWNINRWHIPQGLVKLKKIYNGQPAKYENVCHFFVFTPILT